MRDRYRGEMKMYNSHRLIPIHTYISSHDMYRGAELHERQEVRRDDKSDIL